MFPAKAQILTRKITNMLTRGNTCCLSSSARHKHVFTSADGFAQRPYQSKLPG